MNAKLTLTIDKEVIEQAKRYAKSENRSLSNLIENLLKTVTADKEEPKYDEIHSDVAALRGSFKMPKNLSLDYKKELREAKDKKFLKYLND